MKCLGLCFNLAIYKQGTYRPKGKVLNPVPPSKRCKGLESRIAEDSNITRIELFFDDGSKKVYDSYKIIKNINPIE